MNTQLSKTNAPGILILMLTLLVPAFSVVMAQVPVDENGDPMVALADENYAQNEALAASAPLSSTELEELIGPVALYPDDLLAIVLPASTYPLEIVQAARFLQQLELDSSLKPDDAWDESITALLNYPEVIRMMDEDIDWTWRLGEAVISQQVAVIAAVEVFRDRAYAAGNLKTDDYQTVSLEEGAIEIESADEEIIYVPYYEPAEVVVYQPQPVYHYYPQPRPVYYYPYPVGHHFASSYFWGVTTAFTIGWSSHNLHVYHPSYFGHPYYGSHYYGHYYRRPSVNIYNSWYVNNSYRTSRYNHRDGDYWRPRQRSGSRPYTSSARNRHYPPATTSRTTTRSSAGHSGRMDLGLRQRNRSATNRAVVNNDQQRRVVTAANSRRDSSSRERQQNRSVRSAANRSETIRRTSSGRDEIQFRERRDTNAATRSRTPSVATSARHSQREPTRPVRTASNANSRRAIPTLAANTGPSRERPNTANSAPRQRSAQPAAQRATVQRASARPATQRSAPQRQRAAAIPQQRAPARQQTAQSSSRSSTGSRQKQKQKESSSGARRRNRK